MSLIDELKSNIRIGDVAAQYGEVHRRGSVQVCRCLCGQNSDRNPSFTLYEGGAGAGGDHFHCYACGRHGSVIDLVMLTEGLDLKAACQFLRDRYLHGGSSVYDTPIRRIQPVPTPATHGPMREDVALLLGEVMRCYEGNLTKSPQARTILHKRGLTDQTITTLHLGYATGDLARHLYERGLSLVLAARIGLLTRRGELMQDRIVFPILNAQAQPQFLIGRATHAKQQPKYLGLPDGLVHKWSMVAGAQTKRTKRGCILVEGAVDFAALVQWQLSGDWLCIALLGTAYARVVAHLRQAFPHLPVLIVLDQDKAGKAAALKAALALQDVGIQSRIVIDVDRLISPPEQPLVDEMNQHQLVCPVHWRGRAKDCGDLLSQPDGRQQFMQAITSREVMVGTGDEGNG